LEKLKAAFNLNRDEITVANHFGLFTPDPVGDKAAMVARFRLAGAFVADKIASGNVAEKMKKIFGHQVRSFGRGRWQLFGEFTLDVTSDEVCGACGGLRRVVSHRR
jgi:hypothetical protein